MGTSGWRDLGKIAVALNKSAYGYGDYIEIPKVAVKKVKRLKIYSFGDIMFVC